ncbi:MAG: HAMP domain-containing histidine kinase [Candidatus Marinimicrobia bacterium]|nr:HAMP domain-containing histidine kinase [Candidatus Neomarinimicrobiota bacterium]MBL7022493.1 HAMP domain-containing histidine kinase [Candidatus Neomarinimicrobiota bacterium]MBL7108652.1 HAMP domain-containing histidine kinase [Candidatus Neomarinimicrobiota bacterium]
MSFLDIPEPIDEDLSRFSSAQSLRHRSNWFIRLRTIAVAVSVILVLMAKQVLSNLNPTLLLLPIGTLAFVNFLYWFRNQKAQLTNRQTERSLIKIQMLFDLVILTVLMHYSGGIENPLFFIYFIHVIIASLMFPGKQVYQIAFLAIILFTGEVLLSIDLFGGKLALLQHYHVLSEAYHLHDQNYIFMMLGMFWFVILFTAFIASSMMNRYRIIRDKLIKKQRQLISTEKEKIDFFRFATHEMKTPMVTVQSAIDTILELSKDSLDEKSIDLLRRSRGRTQQAIDMVKDLGDMTQGTIPNKLEKSKIDISNTIRNIVDEEMLNNQNNLTIIQNIPSDYWVTTYQSLFEKIISNLVSNAIRYSDDGEIIISLIPKNTVFEITVQDFGIGMTLEQQRKVFDEFYRAPQAKKHTTTGTGLGMSIVKRFIEKMNGHISMKSEVGKGTTFKMELPVNV